MNFQEKLNKIIVDRELEKEKKMRIIGLLVEAGADAREALIEGLLPRKLGFNESKTFFELFRQLVLGTAQFLTHGNEEEPAFATLYSCLSAFSTHDEELVKAFSVIADIETYPPVIWEISEFFRMNECDKDVEIKSRFLQAYLNHDRALPICNGLLVFAWSENIDHSRLEKRRLTPTTEGWFDPVKPSLAAGKQSATILYILQCRRMGAKLTELIRLEVFTPTQGFGAISSKKVPVLQYVAEELPVEFRDILFVLLIPDNFPVDQAGEATDVDLNSPEVVTEVYGLVDVDATVADGTCTFRQLIMKARRLRARHAAFIQSMMALGEGHSSVFLEGTLDVLVKMIALETGQWV